MRFKFVHAADLHLDSPCRGIRLDSPVLPAFQRATLEALERIVTLCLDEKADFLLLAGDLFDSKDRSIRARLALQQQLGRLAARQVPAFVVHGNHDPLELGPGRVPWPDNVTTFGSAWEEVEVRRADGQVLCTVQGVSYPSERVTDDLSARFGKRGPHFAVGLLHANLAGTQGHANYAPCTREGLAERKLDYWALGHVHTRAEIRLPGGALAVYPGNPQGRHVNEDGPRGCYLVEVDQGRASAHFVPTDIVRWERLSVDLTGLETLDALWDSVDQVVTHACSESGRSYAVRLTLVGHGPLHDELLRPGAREHTEDALRERLARRAVPIELESLRDETRPDFQLPRVAEAGGLAGAVADLALSTDEAVVDEVFSDEGLVRLEAALLQAQLPSVRPQARRLVEEAALRAIEQLTGEEPT